MIRCSTRITYQSSNFYLFITNSHRYIHAAPSFSRTTKDWTISCIFVEIVNLKCTHRRSVQMMNNKKFKVDKSYFLFFSLKCYNMLMRWLFIGWKMDEFYFTTGFKSSPFDWQNYLDWWNEFHILSCPQMWLLLFL